MSRANESGTITLGGRQLKVEAFTFDQLQDLSVPLAELGKPIKEGGVLAMRDLIAVAARGQIEPEELAALKVSMLEIRRAVDRILEVSGFAALGEAEAGPKAR